MLEIIPLSSLVKVFSDEKPTAKPFDKMSLFKNEKASVQVAFKSDSDTTVTVETESDINGAFRLYSVEEIYSSLAAPKWQDGYTLRKNSGKFPDLLRPLNKPLKIEKDKWNSVWIELSPDPVLPSGAHTLKVALKSGEDTANAEFTFDVIDGLLPAQSLVYTNWLHTDCLSTYYKTEVFSERYWEIVENFLSTAVEYGMNTVLTPIFTPPLDTKPGGERTTVQLVGVNFENGKYNFDFSRLDRWIEMCERVGIRYYEFSHLFTQWGAKKCPKIVACVNGETRKIFGWDTNADGEEYRKFLTEFSLAFKPYIYSKGLEKRVFFHVSDEPSKSMLSAYKKASDTVRALFGEFKIIDALSDYKFYKKGVIKMPIPSNDHIKPFIGRVPELWTYTCCVQAKKVSNRFFSMPSQRNRILGYQMYKFDVKGFLHWGYNFYYTRYSLREADPFTETDAGKEFASGDSFVVYPDSDGTPLKSLRLLVFNDGLQDMRALRLMESLMGRKETLELLEKGLKKAITFSEYPHSDIWHLAVREEINNTIRSRLNKQ